MKLRWVKGDLEFGKYKLQYQHEFKDCEFGEVGKRVGEWQDVPVEEEKKEWCEHLILMEREGFKHLESYWGFMRNGNAQNIAKDWVICPICGAKKPS